MTPGVFGMIKVRFYIDGQPEQDHEMPAVPRVGDSVELSLPDGTPIAFVATEVIWPLHEVIPADVVIILTHPGDRAYEAIDRPEWSE